MTGQSRTLFLVLVMVSVIACRAGVLDLAQPTAPTGTPPFPITIAIATATPTPTPPPTPTAHPSAVPFPAMAKLGQKTELPYFRADGSWINLPVPAGTTGAANLVIDNAGRLWLGNDGGVSVFVYGDTHSRPFWVTYTTTDGLPANQINALALDQQGHVWVATPNGAAVFDGDTWATHGPATGLPLAALSDIAIGSDGTVWVSAGSRLYRFNGQRWTSIAGNLLADSPIVVDYEGHVWALTPPDNVSSFDGQRWTAHPNLLPGPLELLTIAPNGHIWAGSGQFGAALSTYDCSQRSIRDRFFARFNGLKWDTVTLNTWENSIPGCGPPYTPLSFDRDGHPWIGYRQFVSTIRRDLNTRGLAGEILTIAVDPRQRNWFGTSQGLAIPVVDLFEPIEYNVRVIYHDARRYSPAGVPIYPQGVRPWLDLLVQEDGQWYGPERSDDELQVRPLDNAIARWQASGGFSALANGEAWWNESAARGVATLVGPQNTPILTVPLQILIDAAARED